MNRKTVSIIGGGLVAFGLTAYFFGFMAGEGSAKNSLEARRPVAPLMVPVTPRGGAQRPTPRPDISQSQPTPDPYAIYLGITDTDPTKSCSVHLDKTNDFPGIDEQTEIRRGKSRVILPPGGRFVNRLGEEMECVMQIAGADENGNIIYRPVLLPPLEQPLNLNRPSNIPSEEDHDIRLAQKLDDILQEKGLDPKRFGGENHISYGHGRRA